MSPFRRPGLSVGNGLLVSGYNVVSAGVRVYYTAAGAAASLLCYVNNLGCFRAGTLVLASKGLEPIETIQLGRRVITTKTDERGPALDPEKTRLIKLSFVKNGQEFKMSFLRPAKLVEGLCPGDTMNIAVMELAVRGSARVLAIEPCPSIEDGPGSVVTGAFNSRTVDLYKLKLKDLDESIQVTGNHPIFSEDRHDFVMASNLKEGEHLRTRNGVAIVETISRNSGEWTVYNMEVSEAHRYYVTDQLVLVHNDNGFTFASESDALAQRDKLIELLEFTRFEMPELGPELRLTLDLMEQAIEKKFPGLLEP